MWKRRAVSEGDRAGLHVPAKLGLALMLTVVLGFVGGCGFGGGAREQAILEFDETYVSSMGPDGFDESFGPGTLGLDESIRVTIPPEAAPEGTEVRVRVVFDRPKVGMTNGGGLMQRAGLTADIDLDGGAVQPAVPVIVEVSEQEDEAGEDPMVAATVNDGVYEPLRTTRLSRDGYVVHRAEMDHLSIASFFRVDTSGVSRAVSGAWDRISAATDRPDCVGRSVTIDTREYTAGLARRIDGNRITGDTSEAVWPCLEVDSAGNMLVTLESNGPVGWKIRSRPEPGAVWSTGTAFDDIAAGVVATSMSEVSGSDGFVMPGMVANLRYAEPAQQIELTQDPLPGLLLSLAYGIDQSIGLFGAEVGAAADAAVSAKDLGDCFLSLLDAGGDIDDASATVDAVITCFQTSLGDGPFDKLVGVALGALTTGLQLVVGGFSGAWDTVRGEARLAVVIDGGEGAPDAGGSAQVFQSPTGNITCQIGGQFSGRFGGDVAPRGACTAMTFTGDAPKPDCTSDGNVTALERAAALDSRGNAVQGLCAGGQPFAMSTRSADLPVLGYGQSRSDDRVRCTSRRDGMTCEDLETGQEFTIASEGILLNGSSPRGLANDSPMDGSMRIVNTTWQRHGGSLRLAPDWTGRLAVNSGAMTGGEWAVRWERVSDTELRLTVGSQVSSYPQSLGDAGPVPGSRYSATMTPGGSRLRMRLLSGPGMESLELCSSTAMGRDCGA